MLTASLSSCDSNNPHIKYVPSTSQDPPLNMNPRPRLWCRHRDGTPGGQMVSEQFRVDWATVLVSSFSTIVIRFDGHGSGFQGTNLLHEVRRQLGKLEEGDQLEALR